MKLQHEQLAIGVPGGCEIAAHIAQLQAELIADATEEDVRLGIDQVLLCDDGRNCFNEIGLGPVIKTMRVLVPELTRGVHWLYGNPSPLIGRQGTIVGYRECGTAQGCPLGSLLCAMAFVPIAEETNRVVATILAEETLQIEQERAQRELAALGGTAPAVAPPNPGDGFRFLGATAATVGNGRGRAVVGLDPGNNDPGGGFRPLGATAATGNGLGTAAVGVGIGIGPDPGGGDVLIFGAEAGGEFDTGTGPERAGIGVDPDARFFLVARMLVRLLFFADDAMFSGPRRVMIRLCPFLPGIFAVGGITLVLPKGWFWCEMRHWSGWRIFQGVR